MRKRSAFTIIEILIVSAILVVIAGIAFPLLAEIPRNVQTVTMTGVVRLIRQKILYHAAVGDVPLSMEGTPTRSIRRGSATDCSRKTFGPTGH